MTVNMPEHPKNRRATKPLPKKKTSISKLEKPNRLMECHAGDFMVDHQVQRNLNDKRVEEMAADFRPDSMGLITASRRLDNRLYILDGQHRVAAARQANYDGPIATREFQNLTIEEEAGLFLTLNHTRHVSPIERFKVRVTLGDRVAVNVNNILKAYGLHVDYAAAKQGNTVSAIVTLESVYRGAGVWDDGEYSDLVDKTIKPVVKAYATDGSLKDNIFSRAMIEGMGIFQATFGKRIDQDRLVEVLSAIPPKQITARARTRRDAMGGSIGENAAEVIHSIYNNRRRDKLPDFGVVEPRNNVTPKMDPEYVDPAQYALDIPSLEGSNA